VTDDNGGVLSFANPVNTSVKIYNVAGRLVSILVDTILSPGRYNEQWDAMDDNGSVVASGVYYIKLQIGEKHVTKRLIQLK
jgi:flagellar hook assembly protein FlgD